MNGYKAVVEIGANISKFSSAMKQMGSEIKSVTDAAKNRMTGFASNIGSSFSTMGSKVGAIMNEMGQQVKRAVQVSTVALGALGATIGTVGVKYNAMLEQSNIAWGTLLKSQEDGTKMLKDLQTMGAKTPFEFEDLDKSAKLLKAMGVDTKNILPYMTAVGDAVSAVGGSGEQLQSISRAIGQIQTKGKLSAEEMNQLAEAGIGGWDILSKQMGKSTAELMDMAANGELLADQVIPSLVKGLSEDFGGSMEKQSATFSGLMSTLKDNMKMMSAAATVPLFESMKQYLPGIIAQVESLTNWLNGNQDKVAAFFKPFIEIGIEAGKMIGERFMFILNNVFIPLFTYLSQNKDLFSNIFSQASSIMKGLFDVLLANKDIILGFITNLGMFLKGMFDTILANKDVIASVFGVIVEVLTSAGQVMLTLLKQVLDTVIVPLFQYIAQNKDAVVEFFKVFGSLALSLGKVLIDSLGWATENILKPLFETIVAHKEEIVSFFNRFLAAATQLGPAIMNFLGKAYEEVIKPLIQFVIDNKDVFMSMFENLSSIVQTAIPIVTAVLTDLMDNVIRPLIKLFEENKDSVKESFEFIANTITSALQIIFQIYNTVVPVLKKLWSEYGDDITKVVVKAFEIVKVTIDTVLKVVQKLVGAWTAAMNGDWEEFGKIMYEAWEILWDGIKKILKKAVEILADVIPAIIKFAGKLLSQLPEMLVESIKLLAKVGVDIVKGIWEGIKNTGKWLGEKLDGFVTDFITNPIKNALDIHSPSRVMIGLMKYTTQGMVVGLNQGANDVKNAFMNITDMMKDPVEGNVSFNVDSSMAKLSQQQASFSTSLSKDSQINIQLEGDLKDAFISKIEKKVSGSIAGIVGGRVGGRSL